MKLWESFKAWRRGEKRVNGAVRGRVFARPEDPSDKITIPTEAKMELVSMKVTRANGSVELYDAEGNRNG